jgi:hypothetical protein
MVNPIGGSPVVSGGQIVESWSGFGLHVAR